MILDGGPTTVGIESTVIDLSDRAPVLLRPGIVTREELEAVIGPVLLPAPVAESDAPRPAPGMLDRHYAPRAPLVLFRELSEAVQLVAKARAAGGRIAALVHLLSVPGVEVEERLPNDPAGYARELYGALHRLDLPGVALILVERLPAAPEWAGIRDRVERAAR